MVGKVPGQTGSRRSRMELSTCLALFASVGDLMREIFVVVGYWMEALPQVVTVELTWEKTEFCFVVAVASPLYFDLTLLVTMFLKSSSCALPICVYLRFVKTML